MTLINPYEPPVETEAPASRRPWWSTEHIVRETLSAFGCLASAILVNVISWVVLIGGAIAIANLFSIARE
jgi:hypothetical protein